MPQYNEEDVMALKYKEFKAKRVYLVGRREMKL